MQELVSPGDQAIFDAGRALARGELVAFPTETVYGLGADATNGRAVAGIFKAKARPRFNPLIVHVTGLAAAEELAIFGKKAVDLARAYWPGPLTLVLPRRPGCPISDLTTAGLDTLAIRVPAHHIAQALLRAVDRPVAAPSANRSGGVSPTSAGDVTADLGGKIAMILDGGACEIGIESTIIGATGERFALLRPGAVPRVNIEQIIDEPLADPSPVTKRSFWRRSSPGQLKSHYAPAAALRLDAMNVDDGEALLAFGAKVPGHEGAMINLSESGDLIEAAANLFAGLRRLDALGARRIAVMPIPGQGLGEAINDRLRRAAAPR